MNETTIELKKECCLPSVISQMEVTLGFIRLGRSNEITLDDVEVFLTTNIETLKGIQEER